MALLTDWVAGGRAKGEDRTAVVMGPERLTYRQLEERSNQLARALLEAGCRPDDRVAMLLPKSPDAIVSILGVLKAGGVYVPIDTQSPLPRVTKIIEAARPRLCLVVSGTRRLVPDFSDDRVAWIDRKPPPEDAKYAFTLGSLERFESAPASVARRPEDAAHLLFTSGSTGMPKGVIINHANVIAFLEWALDYFKTSDTDRISGHPPLHFDLSTFDIFGTLSAGAELHLVPTQLNLMPNKLCDLIANAELTQWFSVPSLLTYMARFDLPRAGDFPHLKRLLWCGEVLPTPTLVHWMKRLPHVQFTNLYGPTEATIASSYFTVTSVPEDERAPIPIGAACGGEGLLVLDADLRPAPDGEAGDLYISGAGLSPGYWEDPDKTAKAFVSYANPPAEPIRIYRTGDRAIRDADGVHHYLGRDDNQIKSRGYRIELGEIEAALNALEGLGECAVVAMATEGFEGHVICCAYTAQAEHTELGAKELRSMLSKKLPSYMLPARWEAYTVLPRNPNGKIDRVKLRTEFAAKESDATPEGGQR